MNGGIKESVSLHFKKVDDHVSLSFTQQEICKLCNVKKKIECVFVNNPPFIFIQTIERNPIFVEELPKQVIINRKTYQFLCATIYSESPGHFRSIFYLNRHFYFVDDLKLGIDSNIPRVKVITCFYFATF